MVACKLAFGHMAQSYANSEVQQAHNSVFIQGRTPPASPPLPPGLSTPQFIELVEKLQSVVGRDNVHTGQSLLHFSDPFSEDLNNFPSLAVCPRSPPEVRGILELANEYSVPLWTVSRGKNLGYGGPSPRVAGSVILSLYRMSEIIEVNEKQAYAVVEPGVTFLDLYNHCRSRKLALWPSVPAIAWGSIVGNTLDRGFGYTALGDHANYICGLEVVLADGDTIRTGQFAVNDSPNAFACRSQFGPQVDGLFLQSNLGIVTKLGIWIQPQPEATMAVCLELPELDDLDDLVETLNNLRRQDILQNDPSIFDISRQISRLGPRHETYAGPGAIPEDTVRALMQKHGWHYWKVWFSFYGSKDMLASKIRVTKETVCHYNQRARLTYKLLEGLDGESVDAELIPEEWQPMNAGIPTIKFASTLNYNTKAGGFGGHRDFSPILPYDGKFVLKWYKEVVAISRKHGFDSFLGGHAFGKHLVFVHMILFDRTQKEHVKKAKCLWLDLAATAQTYRLTNYRTHLDHMDTVQDTYNFNNNASRRFIEKLKDTLDPSGILSPGKSGIWPKRYRELHEKSFENGEASDAESKTSILAESLSGIFQRHAMSGHKTCLVMFIRSFCSMVELAYSDVSRLVQEAVTELPFTRSGI